MTVVGLARDVVFGAGRNRSVVTGSPEAKAS